MSNPSASTPVDRAPKPSWPTYTPPPLFYIRPFSDKFGSAA